MRILDRYIGREVLSHALLGLAVFTFIFFVPQLVRLMELLVRHSAGTATIALLFLCTLPGVLSFTLPMAVLVGVLIGLGRMSADSEVIAMHSLGLGLRRLLVPIGSLAAAATSLTLVLTIWAGPLALRTYRSLEDQLRASQASFQVLPRVFDERFPGLVLYVQDVEAAATDWRGVFLAESSAENGSRLTLAKEAIVVPDHLGGKLQLSLRNGTTHETVRLDPGRYLVSTFAQSDLPVPVSGMADAPARRVSPAERPLSDLLDDLGPNWRQSRTEFHRRLALPAACLVFALLGVPVGARPRRGGRAAGFLLTLLLIITYYMLFITGAGLARQGALSPWFGMWAPNMLAALIGLVMLPRMDEVRSHGLVQRWADSLPSFRPRGMEKSSFAEASAAAGGSNVRSVAEGPAPLSLFRARRSSALAFPLLIDLYVMRSFAGAFLLVLAAFLLLFDSFTFFELLDDVARHNIPWSVVADYFRYFTPHLIYQLAPLVALVSVLVTLGLLAKNNETTAFSASGVSLYRLTLPLLLVGLVLSASMIVLDDTYLPYANQKQDALRNRIKGRPAQTFYQPRHQWIFGENHKLYNYDLFDPERSLFGGLTVLELDPVTFQMRRRVYAARARWESRRGTWVLEDGWVRDFTGATVTQYRPFPVSTLAELTEPPSYFNREVLQSYQMNWRELRTYIHDLEQAGFDVARLSAQWHKKFAYPLIAPISVLLGIPFAFLVGTRGALGGVTLAVAIAIVYWAISALFEALGAVGQLPPLLAGWSPDAIFAFLGLYFFLKMPT